MKFKSKFNEYFYGNKISDYGIENGFVDYATLAKSFDAVLNNEIISKTIDIGYWEQVNGFIDNSDEIEELEDKIENLELKQEDDENQDEIDDLLNKIDELQEEQNYNPKIFQYYIISDNGADILERETNEIVFYNDELDMYVWGVTHCGTGWDYVLTDIALDIEED